MASVVSGTCSATARHEPELTCTECHCDWKWLLNLASGLSLSARHRLLDLCSSHCPECRRLLDSLPECPVCGASRAVVWEGYGAPEGTGAYVQARAIIDACPGCSRWASQKSYEILEVKRE